MLDFLGRFQRARRADAQLFGRHVGEVGVDKVLNAFNHDVHALFHAADFLVRVQLAAVDYKHGLDIEHRRDSRRRARRSAVFNEVFERVDRYEYDRVFAVRVEMLLYFLARLAVVRQLFGVEHGGAQRYGNTAVIGYENLAVVVEREARRRFAGVAQPARHGYVYNLVVLFEQRVPHVDYDLRRGLRRGNVGIGAHHFVQLRVRQVFAFEIVCGVYYNRHGYNVYAQRFAFLYGNAAVCIRQYSYRHMLFLRDA